MKKDDDNVYILGDTETFIIPVEVSNNDGSLDYVGIAFSNTEPATGDIPVEVTSDLILGFRATRSIEFLIEKLVEIKVKLQESKDEQEEK